MNATDMRCRHPRRQFMRVVARNGVTHVAEVCRDCKANARGPGRWVPRSEVPVSAAELPLWRDLRSAVEKGDQPELFA